MRKENPVPRVAIVGRPNVGKSTLFNRIAGRRRALVGNEPGMTRDRLYAPAEWLGRTFEIVDTGGMIPDAREQMAQEIFRQAQTAIEGAAQLVLVVDAREGPTALDEEIARLLRRTGKPLAVAVNKVDQLQHIYLAADFERLGIRNLFPVSAEHGLGLDELLEHVVASFPMDEAHSEGSSAGDPMTDASVEPAASHSGEPIRVAIIGRPNVGKSTLLNRLLNEERSIVTPLPGTTRDAVDAEIEHEGRRYRLIDTAGIRRKGKTNLLAEKLSVIQARKHLERADVAWVMLDGIEGVTAADAHIAGYAHSSGRSVVLVVNKWDEARTESGNAKKFTGAIRRRMKYLDYAPIVFISALEGRGLGKLMRAAREVAAAREQRISAAELNRFNKSLDFDRAPAPSGRAFRVYYLAQAGVSPPIFLAFTNRPGKLHFSTERYIENQLRLHFEFTGTPIIIKARSSRSKT